MAARLQAWKCSLAPNCQRAPYRLSSMSARPEFGMCRQYRTNRANKLRPFLHGTIVNMLET
jgi:hypothetical protein